MSYKPLTEIYTHQPDQYYGEYLRRISSGNAVISDFMMNMTNAFHVETMDVFNMIYQILRNDKQISLLFASLPQFLREKYAASLLVREIEAICATEGKHFDYKECARTIANRSRMSVYSTIINGYQRILSKEDFTIDDPSDIRRIYDEYIPSAFINRTPDGQYFRKEEAIIRDANAKILYIGGYPESAISGNLASAIRFLKKEDVEMICRSCIFYFFVTDTYPFYDCTRTLSSYIFCSLLSKTLEPITCFRMNQSLLKYETELQRCFTICNEPSNMADLTPMLLKLLEVILHAQMESLNDLNQKKALADEITEAVLKLSDTIDHADMRILTILIMSSIYSDAGIPMNQMETFTSLNYRTVRSRLKKIDEAGLLLTAKVSKTIYYRLDLQKIHQIISENQEEFVNA